MHALTSVTKWLVLIVALHPCTSRALDQAQGCGLLLTEFECENYLEQLAQARTDHERANLKAAHAVLVRERARLCPKRDEPASPDTSGVKGGRNNRGAAPRIWM